MRKTPVEASKTADLRFECDGPLHRLEFTFPKARFLLRTALNGEPAACTWYEQEPGHCLKLTRIKVLVRIDAMIELLVTIPLCEEHFKRFVVIEKDEIIE